MLNAYHKWNLFEKAYFWHNNIAIAILMAGSVAILSFNFIETPFKLGVITGNIIAYALYRKYIWNYFESLEFKWKNDI